MEGKNPKRIGERKEDNLDNNSNTPNEFHSTDSREEHKFNHEIESEKHSEHNFDGKIKSENHERNDIRIDNDPDKKLDISEMQDKVKKNPWMISTVVLGIIALILLVMVFKGGGITGNVVGGGNVISIEEAGQNLIEFGNAQGIELEIIEILDGGEFYNALISVQGQESEVQLTRDGANMVQFIPLDLGGAPSSGQQAQEPSGPPRTKPENENIQTFYDSEKEVCFEDGKPIIRMYSSSGCGYCTWSKPVYEKVVSEYMEQGKIIAYLWEDNNKDLLNDIEMSQEEKDLFHEYSSGGVPVFVFGCKYYRTGASYSREENGEQLEEQELRNVIEDLLILGQ